MLIIALSILTLAGFAALIHAVNHAAAGYENHAGFFAGVESPPIKAATAVEPVVTTSTETVNVGPIKTEVPKVKARKVARKSRKMDSAPTFQMELDSGVPESKGQELVRLMSAGNQVEAHQ